MTVVYKVDAVEIDNSQIRSGRFHFVDVNYFINFFFLFADLFVCALKWKKTKIIVPIALILFKIGLKISNLTLNSKMEKNIDQIFNAFANQTVTLEIHLQRFTDFLILQLFHMFLYNSEV